MIFFKKFQDFIIGAVSVSYAIKVKVNKNKRKIDKNFIFENIG
jgi:hypothetical protein